ncbi:hypothetical protein BH11MYX3_BH11MYX3_19410 [soil metagenome]
MSNFATIDPTSLDSVTGGKTVKPNSSTGSSSGSPELLGQLTGLSSSIKDLAAQKPQSTLGNSNTLLLFGLLAMNRPQQTANVVYVRRGCW